MLWAAISKRERNRKAGGGRGRPAKVTSLEAYRRVRERARRERERKRLRWQRLARRLDGARRGAGTGPGKWSRRARSWVWLGALFLAAVVFELARWVLGRF